MNSKEYWLKCGEELEKLTDNRCRVTAQEIVKLYDGALERIQEQIAQIYGAYVHGYGLTPEQAQQLLTQQQTREIREVLKRMLEETNDPTLKQLLLARLDAPAYAYRISKLEALRDEIYFDALQIAEPETLYAKGRLTDLYKENYYRTAFDLSKERGYNVPFEKLSNRNAAEAIKRYWTTDAASVGSNYSERIWGNTTALAEQLRDTVTQGLMTGTTYTEMIEELTAKIGAAEFRKTITKDGKARVQLTGQGAKYKAARLIRTEGNYISGQARMASYKDAGIEKYLFHSLLELRTCRKCGALDGKDFPVSEQQVGINMHPMHPQCRCYTGPYREKEVLDLLPRNAQTGVDTGDRVPQSMTYEEWREKYVDGSPEMLAAEKKATSKPKTAAVQTEKPKEYKDPVKVTPVPWLEVKQQVKLK